MIDFCWLVRYGDLSYLIILISLKKVTLGFVRFIIYHTCFLRKSHSALNKTKIKKMDIDSMNEEESKTPLIRLRQYAVEQNTFTPLSAFLSLCGLIVPFTQNPDTIIPFLLILSPVYINKNSKILCVCLILTAIFWPASTPSFHSSNHWFLRIDQNDIIMRILMLIDAIYMIVTFKKVGKYKMTPSQVENHQFPILT